MIFLTIDSSTGISVGLCETHMGTFRELASATSDSVRHHAELLTPLIQQVLTQAQINTPEAIIVGTGPGAFTGLRAGIVSARALARAWKIPIYGISSLEVLALAACDQGAQEVVAIIDARRKELFALRARPMGGDDIALISEEHIVNPHDLTRQLRAEPAIIACGSGDLYPELPGERFIVRQEPTVMARLVQSRRARIAAGEKLTLTTEPQYLRRPDIHGGAKAQPSAQR